MTPSGKSSLSAICCCSSASSARAAGRSGKRRSFSIRLIAANESVAPRAALGELRARRRGLVVGDDP